MKVVCIMQARVGSTRLPRKVLKKICGKTILEHDIDRLRLVKNIDEIIIATTVEDRDIEIVKEAERLGVNYFRGSENDVLSRYYLAAKANNAEIVVRVTSDCPLLDSKVTENTISYLIDNLDKYNYVSNTLEATFPRGLDVEAFTFASLERAYNEAKLTREREHVTPYIYTNKDQFRLGCYKNKIDYSNYRWTLDTKEDFELISIIYDRLYKTNPNFNMEDIIKLLVAEPELTKINENIIQKHI
ncbi:glycosyltransferase family protein [Clostridium algoriphilum]|uniref:glycosyltransferase family protein n=1 Tax=Clostridium algoriphilum TaxID=198347 RepID=UPI001CF20D24|nr:glycosyltransferase family protein [Clostridium algoriphilum]MCB2293977.1 glycosyltransferase family protein [Clostridium algoriphilum]